MVAERNDLCQHQPCWTDRRPTAISIMLRRLERQGLVRTLRHPGDGRRRVVMPVSRNDHLGGDDLLTTASAR